MSPLLTLSFMSYLVFYIILYLLLSLELILNLVLLLIFLLIFIILVLYISLYLPLCLSCNDIYWLLGAWCLTYGQIAQLVEHLSNDPTIVGSNLDSAPNTFSFKNAKIIFLIYFLKIYSRIDSLILQIQLYIMYSCDIYMFVCLHITRGACSSVGRAWGSHSQVCGFESHLV